MSEREYQRFTQPKDREPDEFDADLHANRDAGINHEKHGANPEAQAGNAVDITRLHDILPDFTNDELRRIIVLQPGDRLEQGATYIDLRSRDRQEFTATANMVVTEGSYLVPKSVTDYEIWNRLLGIDDPQRTGQA